MESIQREDGGSRLGVSIFPRQLSASQPHTLPDLCLNSPLYKINDETLPHMSVMFDDTIDPSFISDGPGSTPSLRDRSNVKTPAKDQAVLISGSIRKSMAAYSSWLGAPMENGHSVDFSMSIAPPHSEEKDATTVTESSQKEGVHDGARSPESSSHSEKCYIGNESKNGTFDMTKDLNEKSTGLHSTISLSCVRTESNNVTLEKSQEIKEICAERLGSPVSADNASLETVKEKHLNSTVDICVPSNTTTEQPNEKLDHTVDDNPSNVLEQEQCDKDASGRDCQKQGTFSKTSEETSDGSTGYSGPKSSASPCVSAETGETSSADPQSTDRTFTKHNRTTDLTPAGPLSNLNTNVNTTVSMKTPDTELRQSADGGAAEDDAPLSGPSPQQHISTVPVTVSSKVAVCSNRTLEFPDTESKGEENQALFRRRNGVSEQEGHLNLDISQSSMLSLDDTLDMKSRVLFTSTPIVLGRGFDRLRCAKPADMQKRLSVINSIDAQSNDDLVGASEHDGSNASSIKSDTCSQSQKDSAKCTSSSSASESAVVNKPPSKLAVRRKIPQPSCKSNIPRTQIPLRPPTSQATSSAVAKSKAASAPQAINQPETSSSALRSMKRTVQLNKGKNLAPAKNAVTAGCVRTSSISASASGCALTTDSKPSHTVTQPKPCGLQPPGRGRFGLKPPGVVGIPAENNHSQTSNKPSGLSGFAKKHASTDALPLAKRKRTDMQDQLSCAKAPTRSIPCGGTRGSVTAQKEVKPKKPNSGCENCTLLKEKLNTFHQELGGFLQQLGGEPTGCENLLPFQQILNNKFEKCLEEFKRLQADHH